MSRTDAAPRAQTTVEPVTEAAVTSPPEGPATLRDDLRRLRPVLAALMAGLVLAELDATVLATALPTVVGELGGGDQLLWATTAYLVTGTVMMPVLGRLGDLLGRRPVFLAALAVLIVGSVLGGLAVDLTTLVAARAVQGLGGGGLVVLVYAVLADLLPARRRAPVMTAVGAVFAACAVAGPLLGGWLAQGAGWRWAFWLNVPLGVLALLLGARTLPRGRPGRGRVHIDAAGIALLTATVLSLTLLFTAAAARGAQWTWLTVGAGLTGLSALALVVAERRARQPLLPPSCSVTAPSSSRCSAASSWVPPCSARWATCPPTSRWRPA